MSDLLQIFTGNPMSTFLGKKIEAATRPELESEDWALNMEICDIINENDDDAKDAARAIRKRLQQIEQDRNFIITNRTLTVLETCVNNCSHRFHILVMTKDFIQDLVKLIGPKNNPPIDLQERVLSLIENWADAFRNQPDLNGVVSVYSELKAKGVTFPPRDPSSRVPIQTPQRTVPTVSMPAPAVQGPGADRQTRPMSASGPMLPPVPTHPAGQVMLEGEGYNKISQDLVIVQSSIEMFDDIMRALETPAGGEPDWRLADELSVTCRQMKDRIVDLIERIANEDLTIELLRLNDELNNTFTKYESLSKNRRPERAAGDAPQPSVPAERAATVQASAAGPAGQSSTVRPRPSGASTAGEPVAERPKLSGVSSNTLNELSLIDFNASRGGEESGTGATPASLAQKVQTTTSQSASMDPFGTPSERPSGDKQTQRSLADELKGLDLGGGAARSSGGASAAQKPAGSSNLPEEISSVREQDFAEIENWLATDSGRGPASTSDDMPSVISVPASEFDNFIASRALAGSSTPAQQSKAPTEQKPEPSS